MTTTYPSVDRHRYKNHYSKQQQQQFRNTPSIEYNTVTPTPPTYYKQHHDITVATTYPSVTNDHHHYSDNEPRVHVEYNGASNNEGNNNNNKIEQSHQVYEQHHIYKRDRN